MKYVVEVKAFGRHVVRIVEAKTPEAARERVLSQVGFAVKVEPQAGALQ